MISKNDIEPEIPSFLNIEHDATRTIYTDSDHNTWSHYKVFSQNVSYAVKMLKEDG